MRTFSGTDQFKELQNVVINSYSKVFPIEKNGYKLELEKMWLDDSLADPQDYTTQKKVKLAGGTFGAPLMASITLKDQNGKVVDKMDKIRLATIPRITPRGSYIVNGNEYQVANQMIRKPGAYVVKTKKGDTFKGMVVLGGERNQNFEVNFDPTTNKYTANIGKSNLPLYPLLKSLGATDKELISAWGEKIFAANRTEKPQDYLKLADKLVKVKAKDTPEAMSAIQNHAKGMKVDPHVTKLTLGQPHESLSRGLLLDTSKKILGAYQGKHEPDDPENLLFKEIRSTEDMLQDRLGSKKEQDNLKKMLSKHLGRRDSIKRLIDFRKLTAPVEGFFTSDHRTSTPEQYNPIHMVAEQNKLTVHGVGGITSEHAVTPELREVHPSHVGFVDATHTPESSKLGTTLHIASGVVKDGRNMRTFVRNMRTGKMELLTPQELYSNTVAFPDEHKDGKFVNPTGVRAQRQGKLDLVPAHKVDYILPHPTGLFSHSTNLVPFLKNNQGTRVMMAAKMLGQAIPLVEREAPLVQTATIMGKTFHEEFGEKFSIRAPVDGTVTAVHPDYIEVDKRKIPIYNNFPLNQKTQIHHTPLVQVGDKVKRNQLLADSNYTDKGTLAVGKNLNVAYLPYHGYTFEDGIVITESAAKKLSAEQNYRHSFKLEQGKTDASLKKFLAYHPTAMTKDMIGGYDSDGVIKKGQKVKPGQILIAGLTNALHSPENMTLKRINKSLQIPWSNSSVKYTGEFEGVVTDVVKKGDKIDVYVKSVEPAKASDKLSGVFGNKGVITKVIPDHEAPRTKDGVVPDVFLNPHGIIGRINLGQLYESAAGKIAKKTGKPYVVQNFDHEDTIRKIKADLAKHGIDDTEEMVTADGKSLGKVHVGTPYILRLAKTGKTGFSARMPGQGYDANMQPVKGGEEGAKALDQLTFFSMLSHGAKKNLLDAHIKSERNDEFWHAIETGKIPPTPQPSFAFNKFVNLLKGAGINVNKSGSEFTLAPMTDKDTLKLSRGKITEPEFLYGKNLQEKKGGFFDTRITGGLNGQHYSHIELPERMPNPIFEGAIKSVAGIKQSDYEGLVNGTLHVGADGKITTKATAGSKTGGEGIASLLRRVDVDGEMAKAKREIKKAKTDADIDRLNRKLRYLAALKELNMSPDEAYTRKYVPVVPPVFRPVQEVQGRGLTVAPPNYLYQNLGLLSKAHDHPVMKLLDDSEKVQLRSETYQAKRQLAGLEPVLTRGKAQPIEGFVSQITSTQPKQGFFLNKLITKKQDLVGRGVITTGTDLHMDEIGIPEKMAKSIFKPFVMREYTMAGIKPDVARKEIEEGAPRAKQMLESAMKKRTVLMNRAPSLHKFSIMAFKPKLSEGLAVEVPPLVFKGFSADTDGDAVQLHVPVSDEALKESTKMFPSNNLWKPGTGELMTVPSQEAAIGLYFLSQTDKGRGEINNILPKEYQVNHQLTSKAAKDLYNKIAKERPKEFPNIIHSLKLLGDQHAYERGFTASLNDIHVDTRMRDAVFKKADREAARIRQSTKDPKVRDNKIADLYEKAAGEAYKHVKAQLKGKDSSFYHMVESGARGKDGQLMQLVSAPGIVLGARGKKIPVPIRKSYAEGVTTSDYFASSYGVRKGMLDRAIQTSEPGALNKDIMAAVADHIVLADDCGTKRGITLPTSSKDIYDRVLSKDQHGFKRNTHVTPQLVAELNRRGIKSVEVRTPLKCLHPKGMCSHCAGHDEHGQLPSVGDNVGAKAGQTITEPMTQLTMRCTVSNVFFKYKGKVYSRSMEDIFDLVEGEIISDGHAETKILEDAFVWDRKWWVKATCIQRHLPEVPVHFVKTFSGDAALVQSDHPMFVYKVPDFCGDGGRKVVRFENGGYSTYECLECRRVETIPTADLQPMVSEKIVSDLKIGEDSLWVSYRVPKSSEIKSPMDPYLLGMYAAEGCVRVGNGTERYKDKPVAVVISQFECHREIKDAIEGAVQREGLTSYRRDVDIQIYSPEAAVKVRNLVPGLAHQKRFNFDFMYLCKEDLGDILSGLIDGDGTIARTKSGAYVKLYSSSFILAQQASMMLKRIGINSSTHCVSRSDSAELTHKAQDYSVEFRLDHNSKSWFKKSVKISNTEFNIPTSITKSNYYGPSEIRINRPIRQGYEFYTYDIKTVTKGYNAGFIRNHNTFHTGGISTGGSTTASGLERIKQLLNLPKYVAGEATLSQVSGKVTKIAKTPAGGFDIHVGNQVHTTRPGLTPQVRVGESVARGDKLTDGVIKPQELLKYKGMQAAQNYIVDELHNAYHSQSIPIPINRKTFETVVRAATNSTKVVEAPKHTNYLPGDVIPYTTAVHYNETRRVTVPVHNASGYHLKEAIGKLPALHEVTDKDIPYLKQMGYNSTIDVVKDPLIHAPIIKGITNVPILRKDWMAQLGYRYIKKSLTEGAAQAWKSNVEGTHPVPAFAYGASLGKKKEHY